jgi:hypothetical protein
MCIQDDRIYSWDAPSKLCSVAWLVTTARSRLDVHSLQVKDLFYQTYEDIKTTLETMYTTFSGDSEDVQQEWIRYTQKARQQRQHILPSRRSSCAKLQGLFAAEHQ